VSQARAYAQSRSAVARDTPEQRAALQQAVRHWQADPDLAAVRDPAALAGLSEPERAARQVFWRDVADLLKRAEAGP
jgi:hypothetical protein